MGGDKESSKEAQCMATTPAILTAYVIALPTNGGVG
jgi:hypothetical protein